MDLIFYLSLETSSIYAVTPKEFVGLNQALST